MPAAPRQVVSTVASLATFHANMLQLFSRKLGRPVITANDGLRELRPLLGRRLHNKVRRLDAAYATVRHLTTFFLDDVRHELSGVLMGDPIASSPCAFQPPPRSAAAGADPAKLARLVSRRARKPLASMTSLSPAPFGLASACSAPRIASTTRQI